jgi:hypothetical protein
MILKMIRRFSLMVMTFISLSGCVSHLSKKQCLTINWNHVGLQDGTQGKVQRSLKKSIKDCAVYKLKVDVTGYQLGWRAGTVQFCQPQNAYKLGVAGATYAPVCPVNLATAFARSWHAGLRIYCVPKSGYQRGLKGGALPTFCAKDLAPAFAQAYSKGHVIYQQLSQLRSQLSSVNDDISSAQSTLDYDESSINSDYQTISNIKDNLQYETDDAAKANDYQLLSQANDDIDTQHQDIDSQQSELGGDNQRKLQLQSRINDIEAHSAYKPSV